MLHLTSSYMNCRVRADLPTPPLPTMITLWRARELWLLFLFAAILLVFCETQLEDPVEELPRRETDSEAVWFPPEGNQMKMPCSVKA